MRPVRPLLLAALLLPPLSGCAVVERLFAQAGGAGPPAAASAPAPDPAEERLLASAARAERAVVLLARLRAADGPAKAAEMPALVPGELRRKVVLDDWTGPLPALLRELADRAGYLFEEAGRPPVRPPVVSVPGGDPRPVLLVLRDVGIRAGAAALVTVDASRGLVLLEWTPGI